MNEVKYKCQAQDCGNEFTVEQGSRQRYCPDCIVKRVLHTNTKRKKGGKK